MAVASAATSHSSTPASTIVVDHIVNDRDDSGWQRVGRPGRDSLGIGEHTTITART